MEKTGKYLILSVATGVGGWLPTLFGTEALSGWSILGGFIGGLAGVYVIYRIDN